MALGQVDQSWKNTDFHVIDQGDAVPWPSPRGSHQAHVDGETQATRKETCVDVKGCCLGFLVPEPDGLVVLDSVFEHGDSYCILG